MQNDIYIWDDFKKGKESAASHIYHKNVDFLYFYGKKFTHNEDLILDTIQELFYYLIKNRKKLGTTDNIRLYLIKSFRRRLLQEINKERKYINIEEGYDFNITFSPEKALILNEENSQKIKYVKKAIKELNQKQREILYYKFTCGYEYDQICEIMSVSYDSARQLTSRAINLMKKLLPKYDLNLFLIFKTLVN
uniref:RNA polymerase sigma factor n=1 Tax=uncultured Draconibacterium sp. TaxID=1573823 RepID=UPI003216A1AE